MPPTKCTLFSKYNREENIDIFFSTTWCRDRLFTSDNADDILKFYDTFSNRDELIQWMKERPKGRAEIIEVEGDKEIIVVIPTADFNGKYAKECRENIFKGLHIVFVESGFPKDPYFNYAHNCNVGIKKAMEYGPKWVVVSNDDMYKIDEASELMEQLSNIDNSKIDTVFTQPTLYHSVPSIIGNPTKIFSFALNLAGYLSKRYKGVKRRYYLLTKLNRNIFYPRRNDRVLEKILNKISFRNVAKFINIMSFGIFSSEFILKNGGNLFDELYVNEMEDTDLSILLSKNKDKTSFINFRIGDRIGSTLGLASDRGARSFLGYAYLSYKIENGYLKL
ncbi:MAG: hypothetical protein QW292_12705 [Candidatus Parvarchaeota archaeon]